MNKLIKYKDKNYCIGFLIELILAKANYLFHKELVDRVYKLTFMTEYSDSNNRYAVDIYIDKEEKDYLMNVISNISEEIVEIQFTNKIDSENIGYYKLRQFIDEDNLTMKMRLKIYRDKNFVIIEPTVSCSYLLTMKDLDIDICPVLLSDNNIQEIINSCE